MSATPLDLDKQWYFSRPALSETLLAGLQAGTGDPVALIGDRRIGKTSFIRNDLLPAAHTKGYITVYIDLWANKSNLLSAIATPLDLALEQVTLPQSKIARALKTPIKKIGAAGASLEWGEAPSFQRPTDPLLALGWLMQQIHAKAKKPLLVVFDEAQEFAASKSNDVLVSALRAALIQSKSFTRVIFTGSSKEQLAQMFTVSKAPLYDGVHLNNFPVLGQDFVKHIAKLCAQRFIKPPLYADLKIIFDLVQHRPSTLIELAIRAGSNAKNIYDIYKENTHSEMNEAAAQLLLAKLSPLKLAILQRLARGAASLTSQDTRIEYAKAIQSKSEIVAAGSVARALSELVQERILSNPDRGIYNFQDVALADWLRQRDAHALA
jgi:uncharacterized protein